MNALHYVVNSSPAQKNVKKSSAGSQADFESIVFYVPIESINGGVTSTASVESSVDISSPTTSSVEFDVGFDLHPGVLLPGSPVLVDGKIMYVDSVMSPEITNSVSINAGSAVTTRRATTNSVSKKANSPVATRSVTANSVDMNVNSPVATRRSTANSVSINANSPVAMSPATANSVSIDANSPVGRSVLSESPFHTNSSPIALSPITVNRNRAILSPEDDGSFDYNPFDKNIVTKPPVKRVAENPVATLVFFDLETTGLAHEIGKCNVQITEISMIAMNRKEFEKSQSSELKDIRLIQKVSLCTRPRASVSYGAAKVTGKCDFYK